MADYENRRRNEFRDWRDRDRRSGEGGSPRYQQHEGYDEREPGDRMRGQDPGFSYGGYGAFTEGYGRGDYGRGAYDREDERGGQDAGGRRMADWQGGHQGHPASGMGGGQGRDRGDQDFWRAGRDMDYGQDFGGYAGRTGSSGMGGRGGAGYGREERMGRDYGSREYGNRDFASRDYGSRDRDERGYGDRSHGARAYDSRSHENRGYEGRFEEGRGYDGGRNDQRYGDHRFGEERVFGRSRGEGRTGGFGEGDRTGRGWEQGRSHHRDDRHHEGRHHEDRHREDRGSESRGSGQGRGWLERAGNEVASWFGLDDAGQYRREDERRAAQHRGRGPRGYSRSDERIREDVSDRLADDAYVDASDIDITVSGGEVTLTGTVDHRMVKRRAEDIAESVPGVRHVQNNLRVGGQENRQQGGSAGTGAGASAMAGMTGAGMTGAGTTGGTQGSASGGAASGATSAGSTTGSGSVSGGGMNIAALGLGDVSGSRTTDQS